MDSVTLKRKPVNLAGSQVQIGDQAPPFKAISNDLKLFQLRDISSPYKVITSFPSLDTPVCDLQVKQFNHHASELSGEVTVVGISKDLPFAQQRFCSMNEIENVKVVSDYRFTSFGYHYGVLVEELNLLARTVFIIDSQNVIRYIQIVDEISKEPDYQDALDKLDKIINQGSEISDKIKSSQKYDHIRDVTDQFDRWELTPEDNLTATFKLPPEKSPRFLVKAVVVISDEYDFQPYITLRENILNLKLNNSRKIDISDNFINFLKSIDRIKI
jgi:thioredoxin-dependent peroxiredoxin